MALPIITGGAILGFMTWGKDIFGENTFKKIMAAGTVVLILGLGYIGYKMYDAWKNTKEKIDDAYETTGEIVEKGWQWILEVGERGNQDIEWLKTATPKEYIYAIDETAGKITPGDYENSKEEDASLLEKIYWAPTNIILGTKENIFDTKENILNTPSWIKEKLKFW